jgi:hypothetical protein
MQCSGSGCCEPHGDEKFFYDHILSFLGLPLLLSIQKKSQ